LLSVLLEHPRGTMLRFLIAELDPEGRSRSHQPNPEQGRGPPSSTHGRASGWDSRHRRSATPRPGRRERKKAKWCSSNLNLRDFVAVDCLCPSVLANHRTVVIAHPHGIVLTEKNPWLVLVIGRESMTGHLESRPNPDQTKVLQG